VFKGTVGANGEREGEEATGAPVQKLKKPACEPALDCRFGEGKCRRHFSVVAARIWRSTRSAAQATSPPTPMSNANSMDPFVSS